MLFVHNENSFDPSINLAIEEHLLFNFPTNEDILFLYINEPSIIIGRHQNVIEEVNQEYVETSGIHIVRRLSGGGAVYQDHGNLNYSVITKKAPENVHNFRKFTEPIVQALNALGVPALLSVRNDILIHDRKISGNAQYVTTKRMVHHGTLLFNTDLSRLSKALFIKSQNIKSKSIKSVRSTVANISEFLPEIPNIETFRIKLLHEMENRDGKIPQLALIAQDWEVVERLANEKYRTWDWNYGHSPDSTIRKSQNTSSGEIEATIEIQHGRIREIRLFSEHTMQSDTEKIERLLVGIRYNRSDLGAALEGIPERDLIRFLGREDLLAFLV